jgi:DHA1 family bicyclomycin/chloramphenicol resistance-like MFS transporter
MTAQSDTQAENYVSPVHQPMGFAEFVTVIASLMALTALATSAMLPVLVEIARDFALPATNGGQAVLTTFFAGFSIGQLVIGPISDRFGRRVILLWGLVLYIAASLFCVLTQSFEMLLVARFIQGLGAASPRVMTISIVRDCYSGRRMATVMSLAMMVLMTVPVVAPVLGQIIVLFAPWRWIFACLMVYGAAVMLWMVLRMPETLAVERRRTLEPAQILDGIRQAMTNRQTLGYMIATGGSQGCLLATLYAAPQVMGQLLGMAEYFTVAFGFVAAVMSTSAFVNSKLVARFGMRPLSHIAVAANVVISAIFLVIAHLGWVNAVSYLVVMSLLNALYVMASANFNALAMEPQGHIAGTASSLFGSVTTMMSALIAHGIGMAYNGSVIPLAIGLLLTGIGVLATIILTERGRFFLPVERR